MVIALKTAIRIASSHASVDETRPHMLPVRVEASRAWATDGHRLLILERESTPDEVGAYLPSGVKLVEPAKAPPIDAVIPKQELAIALTISPKQLAVLRALSRMISQRTTAIVEFPAEGPATCRLNRASKEDESPVEVVLPDMPVARGHDVRMNLDYLVDAVEAVFVGEKEDAVLRQADKLDVILIRGARGVALVMPCR